jgi:hypothetical protein
MIEEMEIKMRNSLQEVTLHLIQRDQDQLIVDFLGIFRENS